MSSISALPASASRQLRAHVAVVTPVMVVKELLDNAIDAKASSVDISISHDTISKIQVRDNGVGIHPDDYDALARRGHTSKLRSIEDLGSIFGTSLGFRGEALANINMIADITVTTKTSSEPAAATLHLVPNEGGVSKQNMTAAPVGTTVCVSKLFSRQPVRQQMAVKKAKKTLDKVQELLRAYVMARPQLRLHLKVAQPSAKVWSYSLKCEANAKEALVQLFGADMASRCCLRTLEYNESFNGMAVMAGPPPVNTSECFVLEAVMVKPGMAGQKMPKGHYFSVDGRPLDSTRGAAKTLLRVYLDHLRKSNPPEALRDCFIRLDIRCPQKSYDANVEPSKDDVLFSNEHIVLDAFRQLCGEVYHLATSPGQGVPDKPEHDVPLESIEQQDSAHGLAPASEIKRPKSHMSNPGYSSTSNHAHTGHLADTEGRKETETTDKSTPVARTTLLNHCEGDIPSDLEGQANRNNQLHDGAPRQYPPRQPSPLARLGRERVGRVVSASLPGLRNNLLDPHENSDGHSESQSTPDPRILRHALGALGDLAVPKSQQYLQNARLTGVTGSAIPGGPYRSPLSSPSRPLHNQVRKVPGTSPTHSQFILRHQGSKAPWTPPSSAKKSGRSGNTHRPPADAPYQTQISSGRIKTNRQQQGGQGDHVRTYPGFPLPPGGPGADSSMGLQSMVSTAREHLRYQMSQLENEKLAEKTAGQIGRAQPYAQQQSREPFGVLETNTCRRGETNQEDRELISTTLPTGDPRAYLLRRQRSLAAHTTGEKRRKPPRRMKSALLPLENVPCGQEVHSLMLPVDLPGSVLESLVGIFREYDGYIIYGILADGLDMGLASGKEVESRLKDLLAQQKENTGDGSKGDDSIVINLQSTLKGKGVAERGIDG
ncbi:hypothetical protein F5Y17DRAFT_425191 [Xylariaceae sp. FL0594]|nr:hypothetical protein F5Y17DRAFT_425191 [Xylariaceae sp. FL0594]